MQTPQLIQGNIHTDERGTIKFMNDLDLAPVKRFYTIQNASTDMIRAWQGHKIESKWFFVIKGSYKIGVVKVDNFEHPSPDLKPQFFELTESHHQLLIVPKGYANGFMALQPDSVLIVFSDHSLEECKDDNIRIDINTWAFQ